MSAEEISSHFFSGDNLRFCNLNISSHQKQRWAEQETETTTRATDHLWILLRIFVQCSPVREEETFNLAPESERQVSIWDRKRYSLLGLERYTAQSAFGHRFSWPQVHPILKFQKEKQTICLVFRCLTLSQISKNARIEFAFSAPFISQIRKLHITQQFIEFKQLISWRNRTTTRILWSYPRIIYI